MIIIRKILANIGIAKYKLPNILNWLGIRIAFLTIKSESNILFIVNKILYLSSRIIRIIDYISSLSHRIIYYISKYLILSAIWLNPKKQAFKKNLVFLEIILKSKKNKNTDPVVESFSYYSVSEGCKLLSHKIKFFDTNITLQLTKPEVINNNFHISEKYSCIVKLPDTYLAEINNALVIGSTDLILSDDIVLYDGLDHNDQYIIFDERGKIYSSNKKHIYHIKPIGIINNITSDYLSLKIIQNEQIIDKGIHFTKDHAKNYYHWIVECLPRLSLIQKLDKEIPLLIDEDLYPQELELLKIFNLDNRDLIKLKRQNGYLVKNLYYPSPLSIIKDNVNTPDYSNAVIISPKAINFVREVISKQFNNPYKNKFRKLYISRKKAEYRKLLNSEQIENFLITKGFEIVYPDLLSAYAQIELFSKAQVIIGPTGAGMVNLIFAPKDCKILIMSSDVPEANLRVFHTLATSLGIDLKFLIGPHVKIQIISPMHSDYSIDINLLRGYVNSL